MEDLFQVSFFVHVCNEGADGYYLGSTVAIRQQACHEIGLV